MVKPVSVKLTNSPQSSFKYKKIHLPEFEFNWHCHPEYEIMFMVNSKGKRFIGDSIAYYEFGDMFLIGPNLPHTWYTNTANNKLPYHEAIQIQFLENVAGLNLREAPEFMTVAQLFNHASRGLQIKGATRDKVAEIMIRMENEKGLERLVSLLEIFHVLEETDTDKIEYLSTVELSQEFLPELQTRIDKVCTFINQNYKNRLNLEDAARIANMSITAFSRFFKKSTGKTFVQYVNELRIGRACKLLIESQLSIAEICYEVGFNNLSNFNRRFFERHQMSPRQYRQEFTKKF
jgi:AraC-like DNA-binding protein